MDYKETLLAAQARQRSTTCGNGSCARRCCFSPSTSPSTEKTNKTHVLFKVHTQNNKWNEFRKGKRYQSPRKRRKTGLAHSATDEYKEVIKTWSNEGRYPRPTLEQQAAFSRCVESYYIKSDPQFFGKENTQGLSRRHICAMLKKRADLISTLTTDQVRNYDSTMQNAFKDPWKRVVLQELLDTTKLSLNTDPSLGSPDHVAINAFRHAVEWGQHLLRAKGEPRPSLRDRTLLHRVVYDYIFSDSELLNRLKG